MNFLFLLDVRPDPAPVAGIGGLILLAFVVLGITAALIVGLMILCLVINMSARHGRSIAQGHDA